MGLELFSSLELFLIRPQQIPKDLLFPLLVLKGQARWSCVFGEVQNDDELLFGHRT